MRSMLLFGLFLFSLVLLPFVLFAQEVTLSGLAGDVSSLHGLGGLALVVAICQIVLKSVKVSQLRPYWDALGKWKAHVVALLSVVVGVLEVTTSGGTFGSGVTMGLAAALANTGWKEYTRPIAELLPMPGFLKSSKGG